MPSYQQIARHLGVSSRAGVQRHIQALESQGLIARKRHNGSFMIELQSRKVATDLLCSVELIDVTHTGGRYEMGNGSRLAVPRNTIGHLSPEDIFAFRMPDDSMVERHILEDDLVLLERRPYSRRGEVVAALAADSRMVIGLYYQQGRETEIRPANADLEPQIFAADEIAVHGVMRGLIRPFPRNDLSD